MKKPATRAGDVVEVVWSTGGQSDRPRWKASKSMSRIERMWPAAVAAFIDHYNHHRHHESIDNLTPANAYFGRGKTILAERRRIKQQTIQNRRLNHQRQAA